jgi:hypothetical protein
LKNGGWEYAPMFNMKFHPDERSMDMTRRRRWHRKMVPSAEHDHLSNSAGGTMTVNTDVVFRMQSQVTASEDAASKGEQHSADSSPTSNASRDVKIELNAPRMFLSFKSERINFTVM